MPEITHGRLQPRRALLIGRAGLSGVRSEDGRTTIGATTTIAELEDAAEPLGTCARGLADLEIRGQATLGGNLCAPPGEETPRGDLQAALLALDAQVRSTGAGGERTEPVEDFLAAGPAGRLVLDVEFADPEAGASACVRRPHAHAYTIMRVCAARVGGELRVAVSGAGPDGRAQPRGRARAGRRRRRRRRRRARARRRDPPRRCPGVELVPGHGRCPCSSAAPSTTCAEGER